VVGPWLSAGLPADERNVNYVTVLEHSVQAAGMLAGIPLPPPVTFPLAQQPPVVAPAVAPAAAPAAPAAAPAAAPDYYAALGLLGLGSGQA